jgi:hypothetical protein
MSVSRVASVNQMLSAGNVHLLVDILVYRTVRERNIYYIVTTLGKVRLKYSPSPDHRCPPMELNKSD